MSKLPSERVRELAKQVNKNPNANDLQYVIEQIQAILNYLDEQAKENQPTETGCKECGFSTELYSNGKCWSSVCKGK